MQCCCLSAKKPDLLDKQQIVCKLDSMDINKDDLLIHDKNFNQKFNDIFWRITNGKEWADKMEFIEILEEMSLNKLDDFMINIAWYACSSNQAIKQCDIITKDNVRYALALFSNYVDEKVKTTFLFKALILYQIKNSRKKLIQEKDQFMLENKHQDLEKMSFQVFENQCMEVLKVLEINFNKDFKKKQTELAIKKMFDQINEDNNECYVSLDNQLNQIFQGARPNNILDKIQEFYNNLSSTKEKSKNQAIENYQRFLDKLTDIEDNLKSLQITNNHNANSRLHPSLPLPNVKKKQNSFIEDDKNKKMRKFSTQDEQIDQDFITSKLKVQDQTSKTDNLSMIKNFSSTFNKTFDELDEQQEFDEKIKNESEEGSMSKYRNYYNKFVKKGANKLKIEESPIRVSQDTYEDILKKDNKKKPSLNERTRRSTAESTNNFGSNRSTTDDLRIRQTTMANESSKIIQEEASENEDFNNLNELLGRITENKQITKMASNNSFALELKSELTPEENKQLMQKQIRELRHMINNSISELEAQNYKERRSKLKLHNSHASHAKTSLKAIAQPQQRNAVAHNIINPNDHAISDEMKNQQQSTKKTNILTTHAVNDDYDDKQYEVIQAIMEGLQQKLVASDVKRRDLMDNDQSMKFTCEPMIARNNKKNKKQKFVAYAQPAFNILRNRFGISNKHFMERIGIMDLLNRLQMRNFSSLKSMLSQGKSGAFFMQSSDGSLILKTITPDEYKFFIMIIKNYCIHMTKNEQTLVQRVQGVQKLVKNNNPVYFIIMENVFGVHQHDIDLLQDLKGSHQGRETTGAQLADKEIARKDINFEHDLMRGDLYFEIDQEFRDMFEDQLKHDIEFFRENNIIDQSLILGVIDNAKRKLSNSQSASNSGGNRIFNSKSLFNHDLDEDQSEEGSEMIEPVGILNKVKSLDRRFTYYFGIIDILTEQTFRKSIETKLKELQAEDVSCIAPHLQGERFYKQIARNILDEKN